MSASEHLDANTVAVFSAGGLTSQERSEAFEHLAGCEACREWIAVYSRINRPRTIPPVWALAAAAVIACAVFAWWLTVPNSTPAAVVPRHVQLPVTMTIMDLDPEPRRDPLPAAWRQVRLAPNLPLRGLKPTPRQVSLQTTVGEKWITIDRSVVP